MSRYDPTQRWYAGLNDERVPTVYDQQEHTQEALVGCPMGEAHREADHRNGKHDARPNPHCVHCRTGASA